MIPTLPLPSLNPLIKIYKAQPTADGTPTWTLHHPVSNKYYQIGWAEFECLARFHRYDDAASLLNAVNEETTLDIDETDIQNLLVFLHTNGLVSGSDALAQAPQDTKTQPLWIKILHHYLFFTLPLFRPQTFLDKFYPVVRPLLGRAFITFSLGLLVIMLVLTIQRADEFVHTFFQLFSVQGAIMIAILFMVIKIFHELGHAFTATKYDVPIPHMGVAFIVLYPVLYTETTGAWRLTSRRARIHIGLAGIITELIIAAYALVLWHILPPGMLQSLAFAVIAISLIGSLLVNLNPLMRFDGYYVLSDAIGLENLHSRAIAFARWQLRKFLFSLDDTCPEDVSEGRTRFLSWFGFAVMVYRFFLFLGIALLVYHLFFQPLGLILMVVELAWFIALPIWKELQIWYERRADIFAHWRTRILSGAVLVMALVFVLPVQGTVSAPAIYHAKSYRAVYPPAPALIASMDLQSGQSVKEGHILLRLESLPLERNIAAADAHLKNLQNLKRREQTDTDLYRERRGSIDEDILAAQDNLESLHRRKDQLVIKAEFDAVIVDVNPDIHEGRNVNPGDLLFRMISPSSSMVTGYVSDDQLSRITNGDFATFFPDFSGFRGQSIEITNIAPVSTKTLHWPELSSIYKGSIAGEYFRDHNNRSAIHPRQSLYAVEFSLRGDAINFVENQSLILKGQVNINGKRSSPAFNMFKRLGALVIRESGLNSL